MPTPSPPSTLRRRLLLVTALLLGVVVVGRVASGRARLVAARADALEKEKDFFLTRVCLDELRGMIEEGEAPTTLSTWLVDPTRQPPPDFLPVLRDWTVKAARHFSLRPAASQRAVYLGYARDQLAGTSTQEVVTRSLTPLDLGAALLALLCLVLGGRAPRASVEAPVEEARAPSPAPARVGPPTPQRGEGRTLERGDRVQRGLVYRDGMKDRNRRK